MMAEQMGEIVIYRTEDGTTTLDVRLEQDSVWLFCSAEIVLLS